MAWSSKCPALCTRALRRLSSFIIWCTALAWSHFLAKRSCHSGISTHFRTNCFQYFFYFELTSSCVMCPVSDGWPPPCGWKMVESVITTVPLLFIFSDHSDLQKFCVFLFEHISVLQVQWCCCDSGFTTVLLRINASLIDAIINLNVRKFVGSGFGQVAYDGLFPPADTLPSVSPR